MQVLNNTFIMAVKKQGKANIDGLVKSPIYFVVGLIQRFAVLRVLPNRRIRHYASYIELFPEPILMAEMTFYLPSYKKNQFTKSMKKRFHLLLTLPVLLVLGCGFLLLLLPSLLNVYLFPRLIADLPFAEKELSLFRITPWKASGTLNLADPDQPVLSAPRFELYYTPASLIRGKISGMVLDSASVHIEMQDGHPVIRGLTGNDSPAVEQSNQNDHALTVVLPLALEKITLKNCSFTLHQAHEKNSTIIVDGRFTIDFLEQPDNKKLLTTVSGQIETRGEAELTGTVALKSVDNGYEAIASLSSLQFRQNNLLFATTATKQPITLQVTGNLEKARYALTNIALVEPEKATLTMQGEIEAQRGLFHGIGHIFLERLKSTVAINFTGETQQSKSNIDYTLTSEAITVTDTSVSPFTLEGTIALDGATLAAQLRGKIPEINLKKNSTKLINLSFQMPLQYPPPQKGAPGGIKIEQIRYQNSNSATLQAKISQSANGISASSLLTTPFVPGLQLLCDGSAQTTGNITAQCRIPATKFDSATLPGFISLPDKLSFTGKLAAKGEFQLTDKLPAGKITLEYRDGILIHGKNKLSDINATFAFPRLPLLQSDPGQLCTIGAVEFGKIKLSDGRIHFRIEDEQSIFLEKFRVSWCGGKVETGSFTLARDMKELETTLYCDRLGFTELLAQLGINQAEGQGSLNGRLPMIISPKGVLFDDGFLFSTPGNSGIVRFNDTRQLRQGIPDMNTGSYLDYSMKALENFSYNWAKLSLNSRNNDLLITMQLDGKPAEPLPFSYKNGQIVPSDKGPGLQHPIRLDVNFRLPVKDLLQYGTNIQSMMEKM